MFALAGLLVMAGCAGEDGKDGAAGVDGADGVSCTVVDNGPSVTITCPNADPVTVADGADGSQGVPGADGASCTMVDNGDGSAVITCGTATFTVRTFVSKAVETCAGCHNAGLSAKHAARNHVTVSNEAVAEANGGADLAITFNVKVDGVDRNDFTRLTTVRSWVYDATNEYGVRTTLDITTFTVTQNWEGNYTITLPGYGSTGATPAAANTTFLANVTTGNLQPAATVVATFGGTMQGQVVSDQACMNCHGEYVFHGTDPVTGIPLGHEDDYNPKGVQACMVCHNRSTTTETRLAQNGTRLMGYVHGIHNSHNMPGAIKLDGTTVVDGGQYYRNGSASLTSRFSIGFPGNMNNCATCHQDPAALADIADRPVSWQLCMSCHIGPPTIVTPGGTVAEVAAGYAWAGFGVANTGTAAAPAFVFGTTTTFDHAGFTAATNCAGCHNGTTARDTLADFHDGMLTERRGVIYGGADQSVVLADTINLEVTGVSIAGGSLSITWTAKDAGGTAYNPCNSDITAGPVFFGLTANATTGQAASNFSVIRSYAQGDDWTNDDVTGGTSPGQPAGSVTLQGTNAASAGYTTCDVSNVATTVVGAVQTATATKGVVGLQGKPQVRFTDGIGTNYEVIQVRAESPTREFDLVDGSLPATLRREIVDVAKCKDCHLGTIYQHGGNRVDSTRLCSLCHNPASSEQNVRVAMGIDTAEAYDGRAGQTYDLRYMLHSIHSAGETGAPLVYYRTNGIYFFGTKEALAKVANWPGTGCQVVAGSGAPSAATGTQCDATNTTQVTKNHNFIEIHYPQPLSNCGACHVNGSDARVPFPTQAVGVTENTGAAPYNDGTNDVLMGPVAASCMSCHQSGDPSIQFGLREHAYSNGWEPTVFVDGRQTLIDLATP